MPRLPLMLCFGLALALGAWAPALATQPLRGPDSGKPVPRYESLKYGEVNGRQGPSTEQRILWTYHRRGLPVEVIAESGPWRRVRDPDGDLSWISASTLEERRMAFVAAPTTVPLLRAPRPEARTVAVLGAGVVAQLEGCQAGWRQLRVGTRHGWAPVTALWGADRCE